MPASLRTSWSFRPSLARHLNSSRHALLSSYMTCTELLSLVPLYKIDMPVLLMYDSRWRPTVTPAIETLCRTVPTMRCEFRCPIFQVPSVAKSPHELIASHAILRTEIGVSCQRTVVRTCYSSKRTLETESCHCTSFLKALEASIRPSFVRLLLAAVVVLILGSWPHSWDRTHIALPHALGGRYAISSP